MKTYDLCVRVPAKTVGTILETLEGEVELLSVKATVEYHQHKTMRYANGRRNKGITGKALALDLLKQGPLTTAELKRAFELKGFAPQSSSPALSELLTEGKIKRTDTGVYTAVKK